MLANNKKQSLPKKCLIAALMIFLAGGTAPLWFQNLAWGNNQVISSSRRNSKTTSSQVKDGELGLRFELQKCQRKSNIVTCYFLLTKTDDVNRSYYKIYANDPSWSGFSRAFTADGNEHIARKVQVGNKRKGGAVLINPIKGVPMQLNINFEIPTKFKKLNAFVIRYNNKEIVFRNVDISE